MENQSEKSGLAFGAYLQYLMDDRRVTSKRLAKECGKSEEFLAMILEGSIVPARGTAIKVINFFQPNLWTRLTFWAFWGDEMALNEIGKAWDKAELASRSDPELLPESETDDNESLAEARRILLVTLQLPIARLMQRLRYCSGLHRIVKKKRGRPRSKPEPAEPKIPKKRGRKPKNPSSDSEIMKEPEVVVEPEVDLKMLDDLSPEEREIVLTLLTMKNSAKEIQNTPLGHRKKPVPDPPPKKKQIPDEEYTPPPREWTRILSNSYKAIPINGIEGAIITRIKELNSIDEVDRYRYLACRNYDKCLSKAAKEMWSGFACYKCIFFHDPEMNADRDSRPVDATGYDATVC